MKFDGFILISVFKIRLMEGLEYITLGEQYWLFSSNEFCFAVLNGRDYDCVTSRGNVGL